MRNEKINPTTGGRVAPVAFPNIFAAFWARAPLFSKITTHKAQGTCLAGKGRLMAQISLAALLAC